jgi:hypothetical protein
MAMKARLESAPATKTSPPLSFSPEVTPHQKILKGEFPIRQTHEDKGAKKCSQ